MTNWNSEAKQLGSSHFWKPQTGSYRVVFLDDGEPTTYTDPKGKTTEQMNFRVEVRGEERVWTVTKAKTVNSLWGQITLLGRYYGTLVGKTFTLLVKFDKSNNKREYTIQEALSLIDEWNQQHESRKPEAPTEESSDSFSPSLVDEVFSEKEKKEAHDAFGPEKQ